MTVAMTVTAEKMEVAEAPTGATWVAVPALAILEVPVLAAAPVIPAPITAAAVPATLEITAMTAVPAVLLPATAAHLTAHPHLKRQAQQQA